MSVQIGNYFSWAQGRRGSSITIYHYCSLTTYSKWNHLTEQWELCISLPVESDVRNAHLRNKPRGAPHCPYGHITRQIHDSVDSSTFVVGPTPTPTPTPTSIDIKDAILGQIYEKIVTGIRYRLAIVAKVANYLYKIHITYASELGGEEQPERLEYGRRRYSTKTGYFYQIGGSCTVLTTTPEERVTSVQHSVFTNCDLLAFCRTAAELCQAEISPAANENYSYLSPDDSVKTGLLSELIERCTACGKMLDLSGTCTLCTRPEINDDWNRDDATVTNKAIIRASKAISRRTPRECLIHSTDPCMCNPSSQGAQRNYTAAPPPFFVTYPKFAVGVELETVLPEPIMERIGGLIHFSNDSTLYPPTNYLAAECKLASTSDKAPLHAARLAYWVRRWGAIVNKNCGLHVHVDRRHFAEEYKEISKALCNIWILFEPFVKALFPARCNGDLTYIYPLSQRLRDDVGERHRSSWVVSGNHHTALALGQGKETFEFRIAPSTTNWYQAYTWIEFVCWLYERAIAEIDSKVAKRPMPRGILALQRGRVAAPRVADFANLCSRALRRALTVHKNLTKAIYITQRDITNYILTEPLTDGEKAIIPHV